MTLPLQLDGIIVHSTILEVLTHWFCRIQNAFFKTCFCDLNKGVFYVLLSKKCNIPHLKLSKVPHVNHNFFYLMWSSIVFAIALAISGGTALPTKVYCGISF